MERGRGDANWDDEFTKKGRAIQRITGTVSFDATLDGQVFFNRHWARKMREHAQAMDRDTPQGRLRAAWLLIKFLDELYSAPSGMSLKVEFWSGFTPAPAPPKPWKEKARDAIAQRMMALKREFRREWRKTPFWQQVRFIFAVPAVIACYLVIGAYAVQAYQGWPELPPPHTWLAKNALTALDFLSNALRGFLT